MAPQLDHIVILVPHKFLLDPPAWMTSNFTISPGGRHGDNKTENKLVIFKDGVYLELISFINDDPERRKGHWWDKPFGIVDYALTTQTPDPAAEYADLRKRLAALGENGKLHNDTPAGYVDPKQGSRLREDGQRIEWNVTFPTGVARGEIPFWCHDLTPRELRVPLDAGSTTHGCGALGIAQISSIVPRETAGRFEKTFEAVVDESAVDRDGGEKVFPVDMVVNVGAVGARLVLQQPADDSGKREVADRGAIIAEIVLKVDKIKDGQTEIVGDVGDGKLRIKFEEMPK